MAHPSVAVLEYHLVGYRRIWRGTVFTSFLMPVLVFFGMGVAVGEFVDRGGGIDMPYVQFIGSGLLAFTGVQIATVEGTYPVLGGFKWHRTYVGMAAAPLRMGDIIAGQLGYVGLRMLLSGVAFLLVMLPFGAVGSGWAVVAPVVTVLTGLAVTAPLFAFTASVDTDNMLTVINRFGLLPMMLFSGSFFPVDQLPAGLLPVAYALPLWHGVELCRAAVLGLDTSWPVAAHAGYLLVWLAGGYLLAVTRFRARLAR